jgi:hypothetical protein
VLARAAEREAQEIERLTEALNRRRQGLDAVVSSLPRCRGNCVRRRTPGRVLVAQPRGDELVIGRAFRPA